MDTNKVRQIVRRVVYRTVGKATSEPKRSKRQLITEADVRSLPRGGQLEILPNALVTPLASQVALERQITFLESIKAQIERPKTDVKKRSEHSGEKTVAVGADHGGFHLKEAIKESIQGLGYHVIDCGTDNTQSVDYPDFAYAVARLVASGTAWRGIMVDGAGIGSCMAANKVPGIRAAMCYDQATAVNSREHNDANVLTLGAGMIGANLALLVCKTWLETPVGAERHVKRVKKISEIERRYLR